MRLFQLIFFLLVTCHSFAQSSAGPAYFFAIGDMPYYPGDFERLDNLIEQLNDQSPLFTIHVGDIKKGASPCTEEYFEEVYSYFQKFNHPLAFTPGDNEWTDCQDFDPIDRLTLLRKIFYANKLTADRGELPVHSQNKYTGYEKYIENQTWNLDSITFGTLHVIGSNNNQKNDDPYRMSEFNERNQANLFWLDKIFEQASQSSSQGVVLMMHGAMIYSKVLKTGFDDIIEKLNENVTKFGKPVLLIYGDAHKFMIDKPLKSADGKVLDNFTALQVFGDRDMHAVKISIDHSKPQLFVIEQEIIEKNK
mgnify:CR=1 FL=1